MKLGKKEIFQFGLLVGFVFLGYYMWASRDITAVKRNPKKLPESLQKLFYTLEQKGYKPETSPVSFAGFFISFLVADIRVIVNSNLVVTFITDPLKPPYVASYKNGVLSGKNGSVEDDDLLNAILQVIENKDYE